MLDKKLQFKEGQTVCIVGNAPELSLESAKADAIAADALLIFAANETELRINLTMLQEAARAGKLVWLAYPKAGKMGTDINRDSIRAIANENGLDPVRQIAIDEIWSALRLKAL